MNIVIRITVGGSVVVCVCMCVGILWLSKILIKGGRT